MGRITEDTVWITSAQSQTTRTAWLMSAADKRSAVHYPQFRHRLRIHHHHHPARPIVLPIRICSTTNGPGGSYSSTATTDRNGVRVVATAVPDIANPADPQAAAREVHVYDAFGRLTRHTDPRGATTFHSTTTAPINRTASPINSAAARTIPIIPLNANASGMEQTVADSGGGTTTYTYNPRGQLDEITGNATYRQHYDYDIYGERHTLTTYGTTTATTTWHFDPPTGLLTFKEYQGGDGTRYSYAADGKIETRTWQRGVTATFDYDTAARDLTQVTYSDTTPAVRYSDHDLLGRPHTVTEVRPDDVNDVTTLSYDPVSGKESTAYAADHSLLPDLSFIAGAPDANGYATGHTLKQGTATITEWTYGNDAFGQTGSLSSGDFSVEFQPQPGTRQTRDQITKLNNTTVHQSTRAIDMLGRVTGIAGSALPTRTMATASASSPPQGINMMTGTAGTTPGARTARSGRMATTTARKSRRQSRPPRIPSLSRGNPSAMFSTEWATGSPAPQSTGANEAMTNYGRDALNRYTSIATPGVADILARSEVPVAFTVVKVTVSSTNAGNLYNAHATVDNSSHGKYSPISITDGTTTKTGHRWLAPASISLP